MRNPQDKDFSVYEFGKEDEEVERSAAGYVLKFGKRSGNPRIDDTAADDTVDFLEAFGGQKRCHHSGRVDAVSKVIDRSNNSCASSDHVLNGVRESEAKSAVPASDDTSFMEAIRLSSLSVQDHTCLGSQGNLIHDCLSEDRVEVAWSSLPLHGTTDNHYSCIFPDSSSNRIQCDTSSDLFKGNMSCSSSPHSSEDGDGKGTVDPQYLVDQAGAEEMDAVDAVIVTPDYLVYRDELYADSQLSFFVDSIRIECFDANRGEGSLVLDWVIADLLLIGCSWNGSIETAFIEVRSKENDSSAITQAHENDISGIMRLMFTVCGSQWSRKEQKIMLLSSKYRNLWKAGLDVQDHKLSCNLKESIPFYPRQQIKDFEETMEDIIYPQGDPDAVSISKRDVELLQPETFINDTIIDFYIKYLKDKIQPDERNRFHFFNSFFFRKLVDLDKDPKNIVDGRAAFLRVRKWTRKLNIFDKDYIFIPVNFNLHWSLLVICHPGEVITFTNEGTNQALRVPCILHLDSIKGSHSGLRGLIQSYLWEEWKERHPEFVEDAMSNFLNLRFVPLELPQQENYYDCGLFLLHYVELFLKAAPVNFNPFKITTFSNFLSADWFVPSEASFKRFLIRNLLYELLGSKGQNDNLQACNGENPPHPFPNDDHNKNAVELFIQQDMIPAAGLEDSSKHTDSRIELDLFKESPRAPHIKDGQFEQQLLDSNAIEGASNQHMNFNFEAVAAFGGSKCPLPPIMEDEENLIQPEIWGTSCQIVDGTPGEICSPSRLSGQPAELEMLGSPEGLIQIEDTPSGSLSEPPSCRYLMESEQNSVEIYTGNSDGLPCANSESLCTSGEENIGLITDDSEHPSAKPGLSVSEKDTDCFSVEDAPVPEPCNSLELIRDDENVKTIPLITEISEACTVQPVTTIPESPETCMKCSQVGDSMTDATSSQDEVMNVEPNSSAVCEVVLDSPDRGIMPIFVNEETPRTSAIAIEENPGTSAIGNDETPGNSDSATRCDSVLPHKDMEPASDFLENDGKIASDDVVVPEDHRRRKRRKVQHSGTPRKQTRSTRALSF